MCSIPLLLGFIISVVLLGKLYEQMFNEDIKIILTSNTKISELYKKSLLKRSDMRKIINYYKNKTKNYKKK